MHTEMCIEIRNVINDIVSSGRYWSKWVDKIWDENCEHKFHLNFSSKLTYVDQKHFIISNGNSNNET